MSEDALKRWAEARGARFAVAGIDLLDTVREQLEQRRGEGQIDSRFFRENLGDLLGPGDLGVSRPEALLIVSAPRPVHTIVLNIGDRSVDVLLPPTYFRYRAFFADILKEIKEALGESVEIAILQAPLKSLSAHLGLTVYGRNNVTYVPDIGSYHQLCGYIVGGDAGIRLRNAFGFPVARGGEGSLRLCATCRACVKACPTGAVRADRFLISAEKCFTLFSENPGPFPESLRRPKTACLLGCMECQTACPENRGRLRFESTGISITAEETAELLAVGERIQNGESLSRQLLESGTPSGVEPDIWNRIAVKFAALRLTGGMDLISRNLRAFFGPPG